MSEFCHPAEVFKPSNWEKVISGACVIEERSPGSIDGIMSFHPRILTMRENEKKRRRLAFMEKMLGV